MTPCCRISGGQNSQRQWSYMRLLGYEEGELIDRPFALILGEESLVTEEKRSDRYFCCG